MKPDKVHVIGAGLSGLAAAVALAEQGIPVEISEAAGQAGGRCRSYFDQSLGLTIDNGNHLVLSGNGAVRTYLETIGTSGRLAGPPTAAFPFIDLTTGEQWTVKPNSGKLPWWIFARSRRVPATTAADYLGLAALRKTTPDQRIGDVLPCKGMLWRRLMHPFLLAALNTEPESASASLAWALLRETLVKGGAACRPLFAAEGLSAIFIEPALSLLAQHGSAVHYNRRLRRLVFVEGNESARLTGLDFGTSVIPLSPRDAVVLAVPPWVAQELAPGIDAPRTFHAIVNGHFKIVPAPQTPPMIGVIGGTVEWIFAFHDRLSITISGADRLLNTDRAELAALLWRDVAAVHGLPAALPPWQIVVEKRATFAATPQENIHRPGTSPRWNNLFLAGDWTDTGLPATIEGALRSGYRAAEFALQRRA
jgi:squalene-associated FAD-dependent desaturase